MQQYDCIEYARAVARRLADESLMEFEKAYAAAPESEDKQFIRDIVHYMIEREL
jgi:geranylgeranyl pyrophosphate synthase